MQGASAGFEALATFDADGDGDPDLAGRQDASEVYRNQFVP